MQIQPEGYPGKSRVAIGDSDRRYAIEVALVCSLSLSSHVFPANFIALFVESTHSVVTSFIKFAYTKAMQGLLSVCFTPKAFRVLGNSQYVAIGLP